MPQSSNYWQDRFTKLEEAQLNTGQSFYNDLDVQYRIASQNVEKEIEAWYERFAVNNQIGLNEAKKMLNSKQLTEFKWSVEDYIKYGEMNGLDPLWMKQLENASAKFHITRLEALKIQTQQQMERLFGNQTDGLDKVARKIYSDGYYHTAYEIQKGFNVGWDLQTINEKQLAQVISKPWTVDNKTFTARCWTNKAELVSSVYTQLTQTIIRGDAPDKAIKAISNQFNVAKNKAGRLVMTESAFFASAAQKDAFNSLNVEKFEIVATLDMHTSDICQGLDGKIIPMKDYAPGVTAPPFHCWCRSVTVPSFDDDYGSRAARGADGKTYYIPSDIKYPEWKNTFVVEPTLSKEMFDLRDLLKNYDIKTYSGIWKDDVKTTDYKTKAASIPAKRDYLENKVTTTSGAEFDKFMQLLSDLNDFEQDGQKYFAMKTRMDEIRQILLDMRTAAGGSDANAALYTQERKDAAHWFTSQKDADALLRPRTGELWKSYDQIEKKAAYGYTSGSGMYNRPLRGYDGGWGDSSFKGVDNVPLNNEGGEAYINALTGALDRSTYNFDIWLQRGIESSRGTASFLQIDESLLNGDFNDLKAAILNKTVKDEGFLSTSAAKGQGFSGTILNLYAPEGTKMIYAEPFSNYGRGGKLAWDGVQTQNDFGSEFEVVVQKGYNYRITKIEKTNGRLYLDVDIIAD